MVENTILNNYYHVFYVVCHSTRRFICYFFQYRVITACQLAIAIEETPTKFEKMRGFVNSDKLPIKQFSFPKETAMAVS